MPSSRSTSPTVSPPLPEPTQTRILETARRHLFAYGYSALTMDELAHELGMSKKTLYLHFSGKDAIVGTIIEEIGRAVRTELEAMISQPKLSFAQRLRAIVDTVGPRLSLLSPAMLRDLQRYAP